jgi:hypothetical protein
MKAIRILKEKLNIELKRRSERRKQLRVYHQLVRDFDQDISKVKEHSLARLREIQDQFEGFAELKDLQVHQLEGFI